MTAATVADRLLDAGRPAYPDFPPVDADALERAAAIRRGRFTYVGETYDLGDAFSWRHNPSRDKEWIVALHKHYLAVDLVHAAAATGDPSYLRSWTRLLASWLDEMGSGFVAQSDAQVEAKRVENWIWALSLLPAAPWRGVVDDALLARLVERIGAEASYISTHLKPVRNHRTFQLYAVALAAVLLPDTDPGGRLRGLAIDLLTTNLLDDLRPDGVHCELSSHYHQLVTETAVGFLELCGRNGIALPTALHERVHEALRFSLWLQWPDGSLPLVNDSDDGRHQDLLRRGAALFDDPALRFGATLGADGTPPVEPARWFGVSGYAVLRDGWGTDAATHARSRHVLVDAALLGEGSHSHYDALSFTYFADGGPALVDPGRYTYSAEPDADGRDWRHHFKSTAAHNTVTVDGRDQTRYLSRTKHGPDARVIDGAHAFGRRSDWVAATVRSEEYAPLHRRTFVHLLRGYLLVLDEVSAADGAEHTYAARFHLPDLEADLRGVASGAVALDGARCRLHCAPPAGARTRVARDWVSTQYGVKHPAAVLEVEVSAVDATWCTVVTPRRSGPDVDVLQRVEVAGATVFRVHGSDTTGPFADVVVLPAGEGPVAAEGIEVVGHWCVVRRDRHGHAVHAVGESVRRLAVDGAVLRAEQAGSSLEWTRG